jgi:hypothetical protein
MAIKLKLVVGLLCRLIFMATLTQRVLQKDTVKSVEHTDK